jgi:thiol:disulfide interchange protein DsbC
MHLRAGFRASLIVLSIAVASVLGWRFLTRPGHGGLVFNIEQRLNGVLHLDRQRVDFTALPLSDAIKTVHGNGARTLVVFSDPYCPGCRQLEANLGQLDNVTIYTFLYPILMPESRKLAVDIWCSTDRSAAWTAWMLHHVPPAPRPNCDSGAVERNIATGRANRVLVTPTVLFVDGKRINDAASADVVKAALAVHSR